MMHNFIAGVRKRSDLLKLFVQSNLVNNMRSSHTDCNRGKVQQLHVQIVCKSHFYNPVY